MSDSRWSLADVNAWDEETFVSRLGFLFEGSPWIARATWTRRPFRDVEELHRELLNVIEEAAPTQQLDLIRAHPDLVGRAALAGTLTRESTGEQRAAGLDPGGLTPEEIARFGELNRRYQDRLGMPFVICARENKKAAILAGFDDRLQNIVDEEIAVALREIGRIGWYRLVDVIDT